ncbi:MAG TPA: alkaline phosphatase family protein, partial [Candidatus Acidoferrum sp.]|nr:alkaline phosphatase family protein [Candidatus Acidoferrum sp.]
MRKKTARSLALALAGLLIQQGSVSAFGPTPPGPSTATPIKHLVVIFPENISFDHYFATYPVAANLADEPPFYAQPGTPTVNGLSGALLTNNPNFLNSANGSGAINPFRLDR